MRPICRVVSLVWLVALGVSRLRAEELPAEQTDCPVKIQEFDIERSGKKFLIAPVKIAGQSFAAMIDTGCTYSVIDTSLRRLLGKEHSQFELGTPAGKRTFRSFQGPEIEFGTRPVKVKPKWVVSLDLSAFRRWSQQDFHVIIGMDVLKQFVLHLDLPQGRATIFDKAPAAPCAATELKYFKHIPSVVGRFGKTASWFLIDTGCVGFEGSLSHAAFNRLQRQGSLTMTGKISTISAGGQAAHRKARLNSLVVANRFYTAAEFSEADSCSVGLVYLSRQAVTLDFPNDVAYFDVPARIRTKSAPQFAIAPLANWR